MTWTPSEVNRRAADLVAALLEAGPECGVSMSGDPGRRILFQCRMVDLIAAALGQAVLDEIKAENRRHAERGSLPPGMRVGADGLLHHDNVPYSKTAEYQAKLAEQKKQNDDMKRRIDKENGLLDDKTWLDGLTEKLAEKRPGSDVNNAADIAAYQEESGEAELARKARAAGPDMTGRCVIPLTTGPPGTVIFHYGKPYIIANDGKAYPPAKDNLREPVATHSLQACDVNMQPSITWTDVPPPPTSIVATHWGEGPTAGLMAEEQIVLGGPTSEPLGNVSGASVDAQSPPVQSLPPKKRPGRPKGSYGKKKKEAMRKAKAAERAAAKAAKAALYPTLDEAPPGPAPEDHHEIDPNTVDVHAHLGPDPGEGASPVVTMDGAEA